ncbi:hypothetical protein SAMN02799642_02712 [Methylobacterium brachiatum]|nr:hypothetical protein SAMN02799642_02712 [Methylobacterium brachiatum]
MDTRRPEKPGGLVLWGHHRNQVVSIPVSARSDSSRYGFSLTTGLAKTALAGALSLLALASSALALPACLEAQRKVDEANALRFQARQEARLGNHDRVCDTLDEVGDRYDDARDAFERCGEGVVAIDLRSELRGLRIAKKINRCD